ncbi:MAG: glycosyltransferase family 39 protein, partial [Alphaproteobacteria bacterium]
MTAALVLMAQVAASVGFGSVVLKGLGLLDELGIGERLAWGFAVGYGVLGWLLFFLGLNGLFSVPALATLLGIGLLGLWTLKGGTVAPVEEWNPLDKGLAALLLLALTFDLLEGMAPPTDADSLAYHFALPKLFIDAGELFFVPRALDGAVPLLNQMTYIPALALGGEKAMTLWTMVSGWAASALLYVIARRFLDRRFSLVVTLVFLTTPAVVFGGGSGHVEVRNAMFVLVAAVSVAHAVKTGHLKYAVMAGLGVGFFMAGKYIGLLFAASCGLAILGQRRWFVHGLVLTLVAVVAGGQWYVWNFINTGDPVFPILFGRLDYSGVPFWNAEQHAALLNQFSNDEHGVPVNPFWLLAYPFVATLGGIVQFESGRVGFGPYVLLVLPFALAGAWRFRDRLKASPLAVIAAIM